MQGRIKLLLQASFPVQHALKVKLRLAPAVAATAAGRRHAGRGEWQSTLQLACDASVGDGERRRGMLTTPRRAGHALEDGAVCELEDFGGDGDRRRAQRCPFGVDDGLLHAPDVWCDVHVALGRE